MPTDNIKKAIIFMLISSLSFAFMGVFVKILVNIPVFEKVFVRNLVSLFIALFVILKKGKPIFGKKENQKYLIARSLLGLSGVILFFYALSNMYLADASILNKISPFFVTLFATLFLKEKLSKIQIPALIIVFIGAIMIIKPRFDFSVIPALAGFLSAIFAGGAYTMVRHLRGKEDPSTIVFYFSFVSVIGISPFLFVDFVIPNFIEALYLIGIGVFAGIAQIALTHSYRYAKASEISIYNYTNIVFSAILGFVIFSEIPDIISIVGGLLIIITAFMVFKYNLKNGSK
ncbi:MAG: EamA family transporter [Candidatus Cloacimonadota bacterium]|nr:MAG: EamA family transporter [Candidatus Cloacimonadota bacterium]PIE79053.1 MAG: EamA family transporter [Candidatus Delongbacteria bacterium]